MHGVEVLRLFIDVLLKVLKSGVKSLFSRPLLPSVTTSLDLLASDVTTSLLDLLLLSWENDRTTHDQLEMCFGIRGINDMICKPLSMKKI